MAATQAAREFEPLSRRATSVLPSPPLVMCATACAAVLTLAGYRVGEEPVSLSHEILAAHSITEALSTMVARSAARPNPTQAQNETPVRERAESENDSQARTEPLAKNDAQSTLSGVRVATGKVFVSLPLALRLANVPMPVVTQLSDAFDRNLALRHEIPTGAEFRLAYTQSDDTMANDAYQLLALQIEGRDRWLDSYYFADADGGGFFDRSGHRTGRIRSRFPVQFTRITSGFSQARYHPLLNVTRPHYGVDLAAPVGTPVRAVAGGRVLEAGWQGGNGRFVKIRHHGGMATGYAHLVRILPGLHPGARVKRGQIIGYVGASGLATGSHLHFVVYRNGVYVDPLRVRFPGPSALHGERLRVFRTTLAEMDELLAGLPHAEPIRTAFVRN